MKTIAKIASLAVMCFALLAAFRGRFDIGSYLMGVAVFLLLSAIDNNSKSEKQS